MRFGVIGCRHGHIHSLIRELLDLPDAECAGIFDADDDAAGRVLERFAVPRVYTQEAILDDPTVSVIGTAAINRDRADIICRALKAGKHVLTDKPMCTRLEDLEAIEQLAGASGLRVGLQLTERFDPYIRRMKALVDEGAIGDVVNVMCLRPHRLSRQGRPDWMFVDDLYGGILVDLAIHDCDIVRWLTGAEFDEITAYEQNHGNPADADFHDIGVMLGLLTNGATVTIRVDWFTPARSPGHGDGRFFVTGTRGTIELRGSGDPWASEPAPQVLLVSDDCEPVSLAPQPPAKSLVADFIDSLTAGSQAQISNQDAFQATRASLAARASARTRKTIHQPHQHFI